MMRNWYLITVSLLIIGIFVVVHPAMSAYFPWKQHETLTSFLTSVKKNQRLDAQRYWEFREFYSPGTFTFEKDYATHAAVTPSVLATDIAALKKMTNLHPYLSFQSKRIESIDALIKSEVPLNKIFTSQNNLVSNDSLIVSDEGTYYLLVAILSSQDAQKANGFFQEEGTSLPPASAYHLTIARIKK